MVTIHVLSPAWQLRIVVFLILAAGWGHADRRVERYRFARRRRSYGYTSHGEYVAGPEWRARRHRYLYERPPAGCRVCGRRWVGHWPLHHVDYSRAGGGGELDRDLIPVCPPCHTRIHQHARKRGVLRRVGVTLRATTWLTIGLHLPGRWTRRLFGVQRRARRDRRPAATR